jgi:DNA-binding transcriptional regulator GbsR (MarR family)
MRLIICLIILPLAISDINPAFAQSRPNSSVKIETLYQLCNIRQREIIAHNKAAIEAGINYLNTKDGVTRDQMMRAIEGYRSSAKEAEDSWYKLGCFDLLYKTPQPNSR